MQEQTISIRAWILKRPQRHQKISDKTGRKACARFFIRIYDNYYKSLLEESKKSFISILFPKRAKIRDVSIQRTWQTEHTFRPCPYNSGYLR